MMVSGSVARTKDLDGSIRWVYGQNGFWKSTIVQGVEDGVVETL